MRYDTANKLSRKLHVYENTASPTKCHLETCTVQSHELNRLYSQQMHWNSLRVYSYNLQDVFILGEYANLMQQRMI